MNAIFAVAAKEFQDGLRNRWLLSITIVFAVLAIGLSYYGSLASGQLETASLATTIASLSSLSVFIIPLIALLLCYDSFVGEQESGTLLLLLTYPISRGQLLLGKFIGQGSIISLATLLGFGSAAILLGFSSSFAAVLPAFSLFIVSSSLLGLSFIALAYIISLVASEKSKAAGIALLLWLFFVLVFDLALLGLLVGMEEGLTQQGLVQVMMFNPADLFRLINLSALQADDVSGALSVAINSEVNPLTLFIIMLGWIVIPLSIALLIFNKKSI
ncbi:ABC transporter permease subunit [Psychromonas hadalis]|uniref:ABC transporter permease subunit n=1 Tax=Psychromonas hadalis TaxID=211669 RepID=UPI0003B731C3|nr:ABC transporter permease subunit [Psychromonas hadalis]